MTSEWVRWRLKSPASPLFTQLFIQAQIKENKWPVTRKMFPLDDVIIIFPSGTSSFVACVSDAGSPAYYDSASKVFEVTGGNPFFTITLETDSSAGTLRIGFGSDTTLSVSDMLNTIVVGVLLTKRCRISAAMIINPLSRYMYCRKQVVEILPWWWQGSVYSGYCYLCITMTS